MQMPVRRTPTPAAFTLVELLVVVGIIALLIAFLLPALQNARKRAVQLTCQSNLRQQGLSLFMYVNDNHGNFPNGDSTDGNYNSAHTLVVLGLGVNGTYLMDAYSGGNGQIWCCPEFASTPGGFDPPVPTSPAGWRSGAQFGGGYLHFFPSLYNTAPRVGYLVLNDPNDGGAYQGGNIFSSTSPYFKAHLPLLQDLAQPSGVQCWVSMNRLDRVKGRWMIKAEWYNAMIPIASNMFFFGNNRHLGRNGKPEGGSILFNDGSVTWSTRLNYQSAWGNCAVVWPRSFSANGAI
jgi:prepilin-type N-terminal cleavage/methylation domain-containing protein